VPVKIDSLSISLPSQATTLEKDSITTATADCAGQPFQLLSLPPELQLVVYAKYLEDADFAVSDHPYFQAFPSLAIERTCCQVSADVRNVRELVLPRVIRVTGHHKTFLYHFLNALASQPKYKWLREHVTTLVVRCKQQLKVPSGVWSLLVEQCPRLSNFDLTSTCLSMVKLTRAFPSSSYIIWRRIPLCLPSLFYRHQAWHTCQNFYARKMTISTVWEAECC